MYPFCNKNTQQEKKKSMPKKKINFNHLKFDVFKNQLFNFLACKGAECFLGAF